MPPYSTSFPWEVTPGPNQQPTSSHQGRSGSNNDTFDMQQVPEVEARPQSYSAAAFYTNASQAVSTTSSCHVGYTSDQIAEQAVQTPESAGQTTFAAEEFGKTSDQAFRNPVTFPPDISYAEDIHAKDNHQRAPSRLASNGDSGRYTLADAYARGDPRKFAITMLHSPRVATLSNVVDQLTAVYDAIDLTLQKDLTHPGPHSTVEDFLKQLDNCKSKWYLIAFLEWTPSLSGYFVGIDGASHPGRMGEKL